MASTAQAMLIEKYRKHYEELESQSRYGKMTLHEFAIDSARAEYNDIVRDFGSESREARKISAAIWLLERKR